LQVGMVRKRPRPRPCPRSSRPVASRSLYFAQHIHIRYIFRAGHRPTSRATSSSSSESSNGCDIADRITHAGVARATAALLRSVRPCACRLLQACLCVPQHVLLIMYTAFVTLSHRRFCNHLLSPRGEVHGSRSPPCPPGRRSLPSAAPSSDFYIPSIWATVLITTHH